MIAKQQEFYDKNRQTLHEIVPLDMPLTVAIEASSACDLRCKFCALSSETALKQRNHVKKNMADETFALVIDQLKKFPRKIKRIGFAGLGEPLMNSHLPDMIKVIKQDGIAFGVSLFTNAVNLTPKTSLALIDAGLDIVTIAVNGLSADDYERNCGRRIDFDEYVKQIAFLYEHKSNLRINLKTVDLCVNNETDKQYFFDTFGDICDYINIETIAPLHKGLDYSVGNIKNTHNVSKFPSIKKTKRVCVLPFRKMFISSLGKINFCDAINGFPYEELDIYKQCLTDIWNGATHTQLLLNQLREINEGPSAICENCIGKHNCSFEADDLDPYAEELYKRIMNAQGKI